LQIFSSGEILMHRFIALLRAVNVGGTGKLPMVELKAMCLGAGFDAVQTYGASGNVVFRSALPAKDVKGALERCLLIFMGKPVCVFMRTAEEMADVVTENPFPDSPPGQTLVFFLDEAPPQDALSRAVGVQGEQMRIGRREIYVLYGPGMGTSKLKIPAAKSGTARNMNTLARLAQMAEAL
jgi:uncharacterized protein (DUF1697 family)